MVVHARHREGVHCMWKGYISGDLPLEVSEALSGIFPESALQNLTYSVSLDTQEVMTYEKIHLYTQGNDCNPDGILVRFTLL